MDTPEKSPAPSFRKPPLYVYVIATVVVWAILLLVARFYFTSDTRFNLKTVSAVCGGFYIGLLSMYIAVHRYRFR